MDVIEAHQYRVFVRNPGEFDQQFEQICLHFFGMTPMGAVKHYELLKKHCPSGYVYRCRVKLGSSENARYGRDQNYKVVTTTCYDDRGEVLPEFAYVFKKANNPILPYGYITTDNAPDNIILSVCWGDLATNGVDSGSALRIGDQWFIQRQSNPHANGRKCATPTGWYMPSNK